MGVFVIAEVGSTWELDLQKLERIACGIKECGADAMKLQWTSSGLGLAQRRGLGEDAAAMYYKWLQYDPAMLIEAKEIADRVGLEFMCTVYLTQDIPVIEPLVKRFKISAFEASWIEFLHAHVPFNKRMIVSKNPDWPKGIPDEGKLHDAWWGKYFGKFWEDLCSGPGQYDELHCVSKYPTPLNELGLAKCRPGDESAEGWGLSDHTTSTLTGALAVAAGATIVEKHIKLSDTPQECPDYPHSLVVDSSNPEFSFKTYVDNIRIAERCM